jgi:hypothetical protein
MSTFEKIRSKLRHRTALMWLTDRLMALGFTVKLSYWVREQVAQTLPAGMQEDDFRDFTFVELTYDDMQKVAADAEGDLSLEYLQGTISLPGVKCYALRHGSQIACMTSFNFVECASKFLPRRMKENEVYCFDMFTMKPYRGRNLAPYLRYKAMQAVEALGKDTFYSISDYLNPPAIRFKKKMHAEFLELHLYVALFNFFKTSRRLK